MDELFINYVNYLHLLFVRCLDSFFRPLPIYSKIVDYQSVLSPTSTPTAFYLTAFYPVTFHPYSLYLTAFYPVTFHPYSLLPCNLPPYGISILHAPFYNLPSFHPTAFHPIAFHTIPSYTLPPPSLSSYTLPSYSPPSYSLPSYSLPSYSLSLNTFPSHTIPSYTLPSCREHSESGFFNRKLDQIADQLEHKI